MIANVPRWALSASTVLATSLLATAAFADDPKPAPPDSSWTSDELPQLPPGKVPDNVQVKPDGGVVVKRTPDKGVDVVARTPSGTVRAYGCDRVEFDPNDKSAPLPPGAAPPCAAPDAPPPPPAQPDRYYAPGGAQPDRYYPQGGYLPPGYYAPAYAPPVAIRPVYAPDPGRKAALITSSLVFGLGTFASGITYLAHIASNDIGDCSLLESCGNRGAKAPLYTMGAIMTFTPSIPRFVVGDVGMGLLWTGLRGGSFALGTAVNWGSDGAFMPITFAFLAPLTLGIIDLATTPHRENLRPRKVQVETASFHLDGIGPSTMVDRGGKTVPALGAMGRF